MGVEGVKPPAAVTANNANPREWGTFGIYLYSCEFVLFVDTDPPAVGSHPTCLGYAMRAARMSNLT